MEGFRIKDFLAREGERLGIRTQEELAAALRVSDQTVSNWVKGKSFPSHEVEYRLFEMGMTTEEMFGKPFPSSADELRRKGALWDVLENSLMNMRNDVKARR